MSEQISSLLQRQQVQWISIHEIDPYPGNTKEHTPEQIDKVAQSIQQYDFDVPIVVDENHVIIKGHARWLALQKLGWKEAPVLIRDDLTDTQVKAARIADNRVTESAWDYEALAIEFDALDLDEFFTGFDAGEIEGLLGGLNVVGFQPEQKTGARKTNNFSQMGTGSDSYDNVPCKIGKIDIFIGGEIYGYILERCETSEADNVEIIEGILRQGLEL